MSTKLKSSDVVNDEAEAARRFEALESNVGLIVKHLKIGEAEKKEPDKEQDKKENENPPPNPIKVLFQNIGLLSKE